MRFIVINKDGDLVAIDTIRQILKTEEGSAIYFKGTEDTTHSEYSPEQLHSQLRSAELMLLRNAS